VTRIRAVLNCVSILWARQLFETVLHVFVLPAYQSATAHAEVVDFSPAFFRPPGWHRSDGVVELVHRSVQQLPHNPVVVETPRFLKQTGTAHPLEVLQQLSASSRETSGTIFRILTSLGTSPLFFRWFLFMGDVVLFTVILFYGTKQSSH
jgi:hypothetical protein